MVMGYHAGWLRGGFLGVDLFFVLSGFLITSILMQEWDRTKAIRLGKFYLRRILRLAPALSAFVAVVYAATHWLVPGLSDQFQARWALAALLYVSNLLIAYGREYPLGYASICWSLAIEEQFYLLWPLALRTALRRGLTGRALAALLLGAIALAGGVRALLLQRGAADPDLWLRVYFAPDTRADSLLWGCLLGLLFARWRPPARYARLGMVSASLAALVLARMATTLNIADLVARPWLFTLSALAAAALVLEVVRDGRLSRLLAWRPLVWIGQLSYSLYLWHAVGMTIGQAAGPAGQAVLPFALAALSHFLIERPFLRLKDRFAPVVVSGRWLAMRERSAAVPRPAAAWVGLPAAGLAALLACAGLGLAWWLRSQPRLALEQARLELAAHPGDPRFLVRLATAQAAVGDGAAAIESYRRARARAPSDPDALTGLGMALLRSGRPDAARACFEEALRGAPGHAQAFVGLGAVALDQNRASEAIAAYREALRISPRDARVYSELGVAYALAGDLPRAIEHFQTAVSLDPDPAFVANLERAEADLARSTELGGKR
jgi:peptidoglycan/LPS O-acetylase OafA/YrhL/Tfp pilus assembly protein PilF